MELAERRSASALALISSQSFLGRRTWVCMVSAFILVATTMLLWYMQAQARRDDMGEPYKGPWRWVSERRKLVAPNPTYQEGRYPPDYPDVPVLMLDEDNSWPASEANAALIAAAPSILEMLRELEWAGGYTDDCDSLIGCCPSCGGTAPGDPGNSEAGKHAPNCRLAALLASVEPPREPT